MFKNNIIIEGNISSINENVEEKYTWFDICQNNTYKDKEGKDVKETSFFSAKINKEKLKDLSLFNIGSFVVVEGIPKSYIDKNKVKRFYIFVLNIYDALTYKRKSQADLEIDYDTDGTMLWNGKRCEATPPSKEEKQEMDNILSEYK